MRYIKLYFNEDTDEDCYLFGKGNIKVQLANFDEIRLDLIKPGNILLGGQVVKRVQQQDGFTDEEQIILLKSDNTKYLIELGLAVIVIMIICIVKLFKGDS